MKRNIILTLPCLAALLAGLDAQTPPGRILGTVVSDDGLPVPGAILVYYQLSDSVVALAPPGTTAVRRLARPPRNLPQLISAAVTSAAGGTFEIANLPTGRYALCVHVSGGGNLDPCRWDRGFGIAVLPGQTTAGNLVRVNRDAVLKVTECHP